jgi:exodeoxyribonuclease V alpha subunit
VPATRLTEVFRQAARSLIVRAAHAIDRGDPPPTGAPDGDDVVRDFFLVQRPGGARVFDEVVSLASDRLPRHYGLDPVADVQVLVPMHKGVVGIEALNDALRERLNPEGAAVKGTPLRLGDRVMQTRNNHERSFYNGELAVVVASDAKRGTLTLAGDDGRRLTLDVAEAGTLRLAYACSVHKMQGSQAPAVVIALARAHAPMLTRNLLYTAVTRSQTACVVVAEEGALPLALGRVDASRRHTRLVELLGS